jgi:NhaP-type Na+/H+ or K+/H+ antiporter
MGILVAKVTIWINHQFQKRRGVSDVMEDIIAIGFILLTYALTELVNGYGFLAVFVAAFVVKRRGRHPQQQRSQLNFTMQIEKLMEVGAILLLGALLRVEQGLEFAVEAAVIAIALLLIIRPVGAWLSTMNDRLHPSTRLLFGWFGIRGIGSIYYLSYAVSEGLPGNITAELRWITYLTVVISIVLYGVTAEPLIAWHEHHIGEDRR